MDVILFITVLAIWAVLFLTVIAGACLIHKINYTEEQAKELSELYRKLEDEIEWISEQIERLKEK